ncbi:MAG: hypothetical protein HEQ39_05875 [Rhizobacter sp.]
MPQFDIQFSRNLAEVAVMLVKQGLDTLESRKTVIYLSRLSMELSLKALLEAAGKSIPEIKKYLHDLQKLLTDVESYEFEMKAVKGQWHSGTEIRKLSVPYGIHQINSRPCKTPATRMNAGDMG